MTPQSGAEEDRVLTALPTQLIERPDGILLRRGVVQVEIPGASAKEIVATIFERLAKEPVSAESIAASFGEPYRSSLITLLDELTRRGFLTVDGGSVPEAGESNIDVFYWHFGTSRDTVNSNIVAGEIMIFGINEITSQLCRQLDRSGVKGYRLIDYPPLRNLSFFDVDGGLNGRWEGTEPLAYPGWLSELDSLESGCLIAGTDFGGAHEMRALNRIAVERGLTFLPVVLQDLVGWIGPLYVPGETACYECLRARENANLVNPETARALEYAAYDGQGVLALHPSITSVLADVTAFELHRLLGGFLPPQVALLEINLLEGTFRQHHVLRVPRCQVCSPSLIRSAAGIEKETYIPEQ
jgi:bacteriocin biosynthesis cyclodehydratase domain-containing protein